MMRVSTKLAILCHSRPILGPTRKPKLLTIIDPIVKIAIDTIYTTFLPFTSEIEDHMIGAKPWMRMKREMESEISPEVAGRERSISATAAGGG